MIDSMGQSRVVPYSQNCAFQIGREIKTYRVSDIALKTIPLKRRQRTEDKLPKTRCW